MIRKTIVASLVLAFLAVAAQAEIFHVEATGEVAWNAIAGDMAGVQSGDPVVMGFDVDSTNYLNSPNFPTRGYEIDLASWSMTVGGVPVPILDPQPFGPAYFVLRNNDPAVDGFLISRNVDFPQPIGVSIPGLVPDHELSFLRTFADGDALPSLDIADAVGTYGLENLSVYNWGIGRFGTFGAEYEYQSITITPEPASLLMLALGCAALVRRR
jgi:hypothetical protein